MIKIGFIILNYNDSDTTIKLVDSIMNYKIIDKIVVVDNCSTDGSFDKLHREYGISCDVIKTDFNGGYAYGNNFGFKYLENNYDPEIVFIANPDIEFSEDYIKQIILQFKKTPQFSMLSGRSIETNGELSNGYWNPPSYTESLLSSFLIYRLINKVVEKAKSKSKHSNFSSSEVIEVGAIQGSFIAVRAEIFRDIGYMDEGTFLFYEENILAKKMKKKGYKTGIMNNLYYKHNHSVTIKKTMKALQVYKVHLQSKQYYEKNYNSTSGIKIFLLNWASKYSLLEQFVMTPLKNIFRIRELNKINKN
ncbi:glycosyltransferase [Exiguobacterium sp. s28]|uniref:glycosyltransferase n=1 Tax=Exiguobacterium sp. s28 TaxID=2751238 RepID=UPI001BEB3491|nr:glycosyltransferase family 2 protein [Exiguobacterium sp. s28]